MKIEILEEAPVYAAGRCCREARVAFSLELVDGMDVRWLAGEEGGVDEDAEDDEDAVVEDEDTLLAQ